ncbi:MAG: hypothetical protein KAS40_09600, partial [Desulfobacterales bacterium]|nr:hypothetical protein [Desulfobacterales bacterium]
MRKQPPELYHSRESTRHFLYSKAEAEDRKNKRIHRPARIQKAIQSIYPDLLTGHSFLHRAAQQLSSAKIFACTVFQIDDGTGSDPERIKSDPVSVHKKTAKFFDDLCGQHNGTWGLVNSGMFG